MNAEADAVPAATPPKTADLVHRIFEIRRTRAELEAKDKELREEAAQIESVLLARADEQGATRISTADGTCIVSEEVLPNIADWDSVWEYIYQNKASHLMQRRLATAAFREMLQNGEDIPGVTTYVKRSLNFRAAR